MPQRSLLVADDIGNRTDAGKRRSRAIRNAATFLAQRLKTGINFLYVEDIRTFPAGKGGPVEFPEWHAQHGQLLEEVCSQYTVPVIRTFRSGPPAEEIVKMLRSRLSPELVVVGTRGRTGVRRLLVGSVAEEVIRHSMRPVMVVGPLAQEREAEFSGQKQVKILIPTDLGKNSRAAESYGLSLAKRLGAGITFFHCLWDTINTVIVNSAYSGMAPFDLDALFEESRSDAAAALKRKAAFVQKHGVPCSYRIEEKAVTSPCAVHQEAESGYAFIVMGTHGRNALLNAFFGSTARETILNAPVPAIIVHSGR